MDKLADYQARASREGQTKFIKSMAPVLIFRGTVMSLPDEEKKALAAHVLRDPKLAAKVEKDDTHQIPSNSVFPLVKRADSANQDRISIGRVRSCDVYVPLAQLSKFHGYVSTVPNAQTHYFTDAESTNGSSINGTKVTANQATELPDLSNLVLGPYLFYFLMPSSFCSYLGTLSKNGET